MARKEEERVPRVVEPRLMLNPGVFLKKAKYHYEQNNLTLAFQCFINYFENLPGLNICPTSIRILFTKLVCKLTAAFEETNNLDEVMAVYIQAMNYFPDNFIIMNLFGVFLFSNGELNLAKTYLEAAVNSNYFPAEKNLLHVKWHILPRWHFRMLNDIKRNSGYRSSIIRGIKKNFRNVFDIGSGCGILSIFAAVEKNVKVVAFEENSSLAKMSQKIFDLNKIKNVELINKNSTQLGEFKRKCNLIVTEIFDVALIGERALESIHHALVTFVKKDEFQIIPASANLYATGINCANLSRKFRVMRNLNELNLGLPCVRVVDPEPYEAEHINASAKFITETNLVFHLNFYDVNQLNQMLYSGNYLESIELKCVEEGEIQALAVWFDLNLDEVTKISTNPANNAVPCWEQAIFYLDHPVYLKVNEKLVVKPLIADSKLIFNVIKPKSNCTNCFEVSKSVVSFLNDAELAQTILKSVDGIPTEALPKQVLDLNIFPLFGLLMAKRGVTVYHVYKDSCDFKFIEHVMQVNNIDNFKMVFLHESNYDTFLYLLKQLDVVYVSPIHVDGSWIKIPLSDNLISTFKPTFAPQKIYLNAVLISSKYLNFCNIVNDFNVFGFKVGQVVNEYTGSEHPYLDLDNDFEHTKLSEIKKFDISDLNKTKFQAPVCVTQNGRLNGILYWFEFRVFDNSDCTFSTEHSSFYSKTCSIVNNKYVRKNDVLSMRVRREEGYMKVSYN